MVRGSHFIQEDSPAEIGRAVADFVRRVRVHQPNANRRGRAPDPDLVFDPADAWRKPVAHKSDLQWALGTGTNGMAIDSSRLTAAS